MTGQGSEQNDKAWYEQWFGREYLELYAHRNESEARRDVDALEELLNLKEHQPVLDLACGGGRHSLELARRGYQVTGIDLSEELLEKARSRAEEEGFEIPFHRHDMRTHPYEKEFGSVINMFTSFGYFEDDRENARIMAAIKRALRSGGVFLIDYINKHAVLKNLVPEDEKLISGKRVTQRRRYREDTNRLEKEIIIEDNGDRREFTESVRLYDEAEMIDLAEGEGLTIDRRLGSLDGNEYSQSAPRLILIGHRP